MAGPLSLWLVPAEEWRRRLDVLIAELAARAGTKAFAAHLTLLGRLHGGEAEALERTAELARRMPPVPVRSPRAAHDTEYYRCVFLEVEPTPELLGAHQRARRAFGGGPDRFRPHVSMAYGRLDEPRRDELAHEIEQSLGLPVALDADRLEVRETGGAPSRWRLCGAFPLEA